MPDVKLAVCDARDVAKAHIEALTNPEAVNNRHIIVNNSEKSESFKDMATWINADFKEKIATTVAPSCLLRFAALFMADLKAVAPMLGKDVRFDNTRMRKVLKIDPPIDARKSVFDMVTDIKRKNLV